jgi:hypothetical protein
MRFYTPYEPTVKLLEFFGLVKGNSKGFPLLISQVSRACLTKTAKLILGSLMLLGSQN